MVKSWRWPSDILPLSFIGVSYPFGKGLLNVRQEEILLYRVRDLGASQTLWQRIFGVGSITITSTDKTAPVLLVKNVKQPFEVKELIHETVEELKISRRMRVGEMSMDVDDHYDFDELTE